MLKITEENFSEKMSDLSSVLQIQEPFNLGRASSQYSKKNIITSREGIDNSPCQEGFEVKRTNNIGTSSFDNESKSLMENDFKGCQTEGVLDLEPIKESISRERDTLGASSKKTSNISSSVNGLMITEETRSMKV